MKTYIFFSLIISGSPYRPKVVDARKVRIMGGWQHFMDSNERVSLTVGERKQFPFDISEAGPGNYIGLDMRIPVSGFPTRSCSNQPAQLQRLARILEFLDIILC